MTVIGLLLILIAALLLVAVVVGGSNDPAVLDMGLFDISTSTMGVFLIGAATVLIFVSGLELLRSGLRRSIARRRELKKARAVLSKEERRDQRRHGDGAHTTDPEGRPVSSSTSTDRGAAETGSSATTTSSQPTGTADTTPGSSQAPADNERRGTTS